jgi:putative transposase
VKTSRFSDSQIIAILKQAEAGSPVPELCREHGFSSATFYKWRAKFGGMDASLMARLRELEEENRRLKKMYAEERLKAEIIQEAMAKSGEAISAARDGAACGSLGPGQHQAGVSGFRHQRHRLSLPATALFGECRNCRSSDPAKETLKKPVFRETAALYPAWLLGCIFRERTFSDHL